MINFFCWCSVVYIGLMLDALLSRCSVAACMNIALMAGLANSVLKKQVSTSPRLDRDEGQQEHLLYPNTHSGQMKLPEAGVAGP